MIYNTFTAANTAKGFFSYFDGLINDPKLKRVYLIKGGPGSGKSTFMKKISQNAEEKGYTVERIYCSGDYTSLDGVRIEELKIVIIDATSPHAYDMGCPGAKDSIIDLSKFWDENKLSQNRAEIERLFGIISAKYKSVYALLAACGNAEKFRDNILESHINKGTVNNDIKKLIKQHAIMPIENAAVNTDRFLSTFTGNGIVTHGETDGMLCDEVTLFEDRFGIAHIILGKLQSYLIKMGYDTISVHSPLTPETKLEQVLVPALRLGFIASGHSFSPEIDGEKIIKTVNTKKYISKEVIVQNKNKLAFIKKLQNELYTAVCDEMGEIKALHDDLEKYYIGAMDFKSLNEFTNAFMSSL